MPMGIRTGIVAGCGLLLVGAASASAQKTADPVAPPEMMQSDKAMDHASAEMAQAA